MSDHGGLLALVAFAVVLLGVPSLLISLLVVMHVQDKTTYWRLLRNSTMSLMVLLPGGACAVGFLMSNPGNNRHTESIAWLLPLGGGLLFIGIFGFYRVRHEVADILARQRQRV